jgi:hypothetical protein
MQLQVEPEVLEEIISDRLYLYVPVAERERARALGAKWDGKVSLWYVAPSAQLARFMRWRPIWPLEDDPIVRVLGMPSSCWKCRSQTLAIIACQYGDQLTLAHKGVLQVLASQLSADELRLIGAGPLRPRYSHATRQSNWSNGCVECDALLGARPLSDNFRALISQGQRDLPAIASARVPVDMLREPRDTRSG